MVRSLLLRLGVLMHLFVCSFVFRRVFCFVFGALTLNICFSCFVSVFRSHADSLCFAAACLGLGVVWLVGVLCVCLFVRLLVGSLVGLLRVVFSSLPYFISSLREIRRAS